MINEHLLEKYFIMGDKFPMTATVKGKVLASIVSPERKTRKKDPREPLEAHKPKNRGKGTRKGQTPAQRAASLLNLAKAKAAKG